MAYLKKHPPLCIPVSVLIGAPCGTTWENLRRGQVDKMGGTWEFKKARLNIQGASSSIPAWPRAAVGRWVWSTVGLAQNWVATCLLKWHSLSTKSLHSSLSSMVCCVTSGSNTRSLFSSSKCSPASPSMSLAIAVKKQAPIPDHFPASQRNACFQPSPIPAHRHQYPKPRCSKGSPFPLPPSLYTSPVSLLASLEKTRSALKEWQQQPGVVSQEQGSGKNKVQLLVIGIVYSTHISWVPTTCQHC